jgi:hypothetical protein
MMLPARHSAAAKSAPFPYNQPAAEEEEIFLGFQRATGNKGKVAELVGFGLAEL